MAVLLLVGLLGIPTPATHAADTSPRIAPLAGTFAFGAAGDYGLSGDARSVMAGMGSSSLDFVLALGDLSYGDATEAEWCAAFEGQVGDGRVILIAGNHDEGGSDGDIDLFRQYCNFGLPVSMAGDYAKEYYFDYPASGPLARFILTSCGVSLHSVDYACVPGDPHYDFLSNAIDAARSAGIPWVIVGMHKNCISNGSKDCAIGEAVQDLLLWKKVDLVLQGHDHDYQRSRRLVCADNDVFHPECVAPAGAWGQVLAIVGTGGAGPDGVGGTPDEPYFETWSEGTYGFLRVDVSAAALDARFVPVNGTYADAFQIARGAPTSDFRVTASPTQVSVAPNQLGFVTVQVDAAPGFTGTVALQVSAPIGVDGSCDPSSLEPSGAATCTFTSGTLGAHEITVTGTSGSVVRSMTVSLSVVQPPPGSDSTPPLILIESPVNGTLLRDGTVRVSGKASDDRGVERVQLSADGTNWTTATGTTSWSGTLTLPAGEQRIRARAVDVAGNVGMAVVRVFVDLTGPGPSGSPGFPVPTLAVYGGVGVAAVLVAAAVIRRARRRRGARPPRHR